MPIDPLYYRLSGADLDRVFEQAFERWITLPLESMDIPAGILQDRVLRIDLRDRLHSAAHYRRYSLRVHFVTAGDDCLRAEIRTARSKYRPGPPRHLTG